MICAVLKLGRPHLSRTMMFEEQKLGLLKTMMCAELQLGNSKARQEDFSRRYLVYYYHEHRVLVL